LEQAPGAPGLQRTATQGEIPSVAERALKIALGEEESVSACFLVPEASEQSSSALLMLAHGAGNDMRNPFLSFVCKGVAGAGIATLKFNFPYKEKGRKAPDPAQKLEATWRAVLDRVRRDPKLEFDRVFAGGKSLGGRMASRVVAQGEQVDGLVFLGYPLHPPGKPENLRTAHFPDITVPSLFIQGTRDNLCDLTLLRRALPQIQGESELHLVEGGDHSFNLPTRLGVKPSDVWQEIVDAVVGWIKAQKRSTRVDELTQN
jgi:predicted alpha/beta-hydrolase family hydrolase